MCLHSTFDLYLEIPAYVSEESVSKYATATAVQHLAQAKYYGDFFYSVTLLLFKKNGWFYIFF